MWRFSGYLKFSKSFQNNGFSFYHQFAWRTSSLVKKIAKKIANSRYKLFRLHFHGFADMTLQLLIITIVSLLLITISPCSRTYCIYSPTFQGKCCYLRWDIFICFRSLTPTEEIFLGCVQFSGMSSLVVV